MVGLEIMYTTPRQTSTLREHAANVAAGDPTRVLTENPSNQIGSTLNWEGRIETTTQNLTSWMTQTDTIDLEVIDAIEVACRDLRWQKLL